MSGVTGQPQEEDKKPNDQSAHINLKVKGQVSFCVWLML
jgi:small ubiquitin-related modifier